MFDEAYLREIMFEKVTEHSSKVSENLSHTIGVLEGCRVGIRLILDALEEDLEVDVKNQLELILRVIGR